MSRKSDPRAPQPGLPPQKATAVYTQLDRLLHAQQFRGSRRCQNLLRYIVERTAAGETAQLKERTLGVEVFERVPDYDTSQDPVVRATAGEIRKKLAQYYQEPGHESELRVDLLPGSYVAEFHPQTNGAHPADQRRTMRVPVKAVLTVAALVLLIVLFFTLLLPPSKDAELHALWRPVLALPGTILISMGQPIVYNLRSAQDQDEIQGIRSPSDLRPESDSIPKNDLVILPDRYVAMGDVICLVHLTSMFEKYGKAYRIRGERSTSFADLRETPAVLIGGFDNQWTLRAVGQLRFTFEKDDAHSTDFVRDRQHPENTEWRLTGAWPYWDVNADYAIVSRIKDTTTDRPLVIAAGITHYGTMAAGEFLTDPEYFAEAAARLPKGWEKKNLQFVLRIPVVNRIGGHPHVLAVHVW